ncbi:hypothetical protein IMCC20628_04890 (plasmid) [Hoeflea sp. IMCC20628]|nr:hypothetical protein IMCC20628_04890 [Hoeflea sp. IMCC20628]
MITIPMHLSRAAKLSQKCRTTSLCPVRHFELHLTDVLAVGGVMFVRHAGSIKLFSIPVA